jgi:hypothetical protein
MQYSLMCPQEQQQQSKTYTRVMYVPSTNAGKKTQ